MRATTDGSSRCDDCEKRLSFLERRLVRDAHANGLTWGQIARSLGVSRQAIHQRYRNLPDIEPETQRQQWERRRREMDELFEQWMTVPGAVDRPGDQAVDP